MGVMTGTRENLLAKTARVFGVTVALGSLTAVATPPIASGAPPRLGANLSVRVSESSVPRGGIYHVRIATRPLAEASRICIFAQESRLLRIVPRVQTRDGPRTCVAVPTDTSGAVRATLRANRSQPLGAVTGNITAISVADRQRRDDLGYQIPLAQRPLDRSLAQQTLAYTTRSGVWLVSARGGSVRRVDAIGATSLAWAPDGKSLVVSREGDSLWLLGTDGSAPRRLTEDCSGDIDPTVSPDGRFIAFTRTTYPPPCYRCTPDQDSCSTFIPEHSGDLMVLEIQNGLLRRFNQPGESLTRPVWDPRTPARIYAVSTPYFESPGQIVTVDVQSGAASRLRPGLPLPPGTSFHRFAVSRKGNDMLAIGTAGLLRFRLPGFSLLQSQYMAPRAQQLSFSPDGRFAGLVERSTGKIYVMSPEANAWWRSVHTPPGDPPTAIGWRPGS